MSQLSIDVRVWAPFQIYSDGMMMMLMGEKMGEELTDMKNSTHLNRL